MYHWLIDSTYVLDYTTPSFLLATAIIILALLGTRFFCGWICPFGSLNDYINQKDYELPAKTDAFLRYIKYFVLFFIIFSKILVGTCVLTGFDPWIAFANIPALPGAFKEIPYAFLVLLLVLIGAFFIKRFFCRYLCPLGALQGILVGTGLVRLKRQGAIICNNCYNCSIQCPVNLKPGIQRSIDLAECIGCLRCTGDNCSRGTTLLEMTFMNKRLKPYPYLTIAFLLFFGIYLGVGYNGTLGASGTADSSIISRNIYHDGIYYGTGVGFAPGLRVKIEVANGQIIKIDVVKHSETSGYYEEAFIKITDGIINSQSTEVDVISGATYTCKGVIEAVEDALEEARP